MISITFLWNHLCNCDLITFQQLLRLSTHLWIHFKLKHEWADSAGFVLYWLQGAKWLQDPFVDLYHDLRHSPHTRKKDVQTCLTRNTRSTPPLTHPPNTKRPLFPAPHAGYSVRETFKRCDRLISSCLCTCESCGVRSGLADFLRPQRVLSRLATSTVPTAITGPVSALHSSLICYRHSSEGTLHAGNLEMLALNVCVFMRKRERKPDSAWLYTCLSKDIVSLCLCYCYHHNTACMQNHTLCQVQSWHLVSNSAKQGSKASSEQIKRHNLLKVDVSLFHDPCTSCDFRSFFSLSLSCLQIKSLFKDICLVQCVNSFLFDLFHIKWTLALFYSTQAVCQRKRKREEGFVKKLNSLRFTHLSTCAYCSVEAVTVKSASDIEQFSILANIVFTAFTRWKTGSLVQSCAGLTDLSPVFYSDCRTGQVPVKC